MWKLWAELVYHIEGGLLASTANNGCNREDLSPGTQEHKGMSSLEADKTSPLCYCMFLGLLLAEQCHRIQ